jgi:hypothetical protein
VIVFRSPYSVLGYITTRAGGKGADRREGNLDSPKNYSWHFFFSIITSKLVFGPIPPGQHPSDHLHTALVLFAFFFFLRWSCSLADQAAPELPSHDTLYSSRPGRARGPRPHPQMGDGVSSPCKIFANGPQQRVRGTA